MTIIRESVDVPKINMKELYRYMGVTGNPDESIVKLAYEAAEKITRAATCRVCYTRLEIERPDNDTIVIGDIKTNSIFLNKRHICFRQQSEERLTDLFPRQERRRQKRLRWTQRLQLWLRRCAMI